MKKKGGQSLIIFTIFLWSLTTHTQVYRVVCLKGATKGEDQKLRGSYHTAYSTVDGYRCYYKFSLDKIAVLTPSQAMILEAYQPNLKIAPLPSHSGKQLYFRDNSYQSIREKLQQSGKSLSELGIPQDAIYQSWEKAQQILEKPLEE